MHDGSLTTLSETVEIYVEGGHSNPYLDPKIEVLDLTEEEIDALVAFMEALEGEGHRDTPHRLPPISQPRTWYRVD